MSLTRCRAATNAAHRRLAARCDTLEPVHSCTHIGADMSPSGYAESELVVAKTRRGTVPEWVTDALPDGLEIASVQPHNHPDYLHVVVR